MPPVAGPRLSVAPLVGMLESQGYSFDPAEGVANGLSKRHRQAIATAKNRGYFTLATADEIACEVLSLHPVEIWGEEYEDKVWFDMHDDEPAEESAMAQVIAFPQRIPQGSVAVAA